MWRNPLFIFWGDLFRRLPYRRYLDLQDRPRRLRALAFSQLTLLLGLVYLLWLGRLAIREREATLLIFLGAETLSYLLLVLVAVDIWHLRGHRPEGLPSSQPWQVDVFVPTFR
jgi:hypothetical protein